MSPEEEKKAFEDRMKQSQELFKWSNIAFDRVVVSLMYKAGEITLEEAVILGNHRDASTFLGFTDAQLRYGRKMKERLSRGNDNRAIQSDLPEGDV